MIKIIGKITKNELNKRIAKRTRKVNHAGVKLGTAIITNIKNIPGVNFARCDIRKNYSGLIAVKDGMFVRHVKDNVLKDSSFKRI